MIENDKCEDIYNTYHNGIFRYALGLLHDMHQAEDVMQETFVRFLNSSLHIQEDKVKAWLYKVARNLCYDNLRKRKREITYQDKAENFYDTFAFYEMITSLSQKEKEIIILKIVGKLTHKEIAGILHMTEHSVKKRYERVIQSLRKTMKGEI